MRTPLRLRYLCQLRDGPVGVFRRRADVFQRVVGGPRRRGTTRGVDDDRPSTDFREETHRRRDLLDAVLALGFVEAGKVDRLEGGVDSVRVDTELLQRVTVGLGVRRALLPSHTLGHQLCLGKPTGGDGADRFDRVADGLPLLVGQK